MGSRPCHPFGDGHGGPKSLEHPMDSSFPTQCLYPLPSGVANESQTLGESHGIQGFYPLPSGVVTVSWIPGASHGLHVPQPVPLSPCPPARALSLCHHPCASPGLSSGFQSPLSLWDVPKGLEMSPQMWDVPRGLGCPQETGNVPSGVGCPQGTGMSPQAWDVPKELEMSLRNWKCPQGLECPLRGGMSPLGRDSSPAAPRASTSVPTPWGPRVIYWRGRSLPPPGGTAWDRDTVGVPPAEEEPPLCDFYFATDGILCVLTNSVVCESFLGLNL